MTLDKRTQARLLAKFKTKQQRRQPQSAFPRGRHHDGTEYVALFCQHNHLTHRGLPCAV